MANSAPTITLTNGAGASIGSLAFTGTGPGGAILQGQTSTTQTFRLYNNATSAANIADAANCALALYDDTVHQGSATQLFLAQGWVQAQNTDYTGVTTGATSGWKALGGAIKLAIGCNSGTLAGSGNKYLAFQMRVVVPSNAVTVPLNWGFWLEYTWVA